MSSTNNSQDTNNLSDLFYRYVNQVYYNGFISGFISGTITTGVLFLILPKSDSYSKIIRV